MPKDVGGSVQNDTRWSEAENLQGHQLSKYRITYTKTKGKKNRTDIPPQKTEGIYSPHAEKPLSGR